MKTLLSTEGFNAIDNGYFLFGTNITIPVIKWYDWLYLWLYPSHYSTDITKDCSVTLEMKYVNGKIFVVSEKIENKK